MRTADANPQTKLKILQVAQDLMITNGYESTTVDQICQKADATKGSFFHYFKSKEALAEELIQHFSKGMEGWMCGCLSEAGEDPLDRIYACIDASMKLADDPKTKGCLVGTFTQEISQTHPKLRQTCCSKLEAGAKLLEKEFVAAKKIYAPQATFKPKELAEYFVSLMQGSFILMKASQDPSVIKSNLRHFKGYLKGLYGR